jgi:hypothetical protein
MGEFDFYAVSTSMSTPLLLISINPAIRISINSTNTATFTWRLEMVVTVMRQWSARIGASCSIRNGITALLVVALPCSMTLELESSGTFMAKLNTVTRRKLQILTCDRITFRTRDGYEGEGLTEPFLSTWKGGAKFLNYKEWDVTALAIQTERAYKCEKGITPLHCDNGPFICRFVTGNENIQDNRLKKWSCGIPIKDEKSLDKVDLPTL